MPPLTQLRQIRLVGMAPPGPPKKLTEQPPRPSAKLTDYVSLDPPHGVFPYLVMTPLLATLYHLHPRSALTQEFMEQIVELLEDDSPRRHNVLLKPNGTEDKIDPHTITLLNALRPDNDLWLVFGFRPISALLSYLLHGPKNEEKDRDKLANTARTFLRHAMKACPNDQPLPPAVPGSAITPLPGIFFHFCTAPDPDGNGVVAALRYAVRAMNVREARIPKIVSVLRSLVPLPHNEAYDQYPIASGQNSFMLCRTLKDHGDDVPPEVFWRYMGRRIAERLLIRSSTIP
jgi:hypothetical protein